MAAPVGSSAGPHGAIIAGYGRTMPAPRPGFNTVGTGTGKWLYVPHPAAKPAHPAAHPAAPLIAANSPLLNPNRTLSGPSLLQAAQGIANAQTQGPISEIGSQIAQNNRQAQGAINQVGGYYNQLGNQAKQGVTDEGNIASALNSKLAGIGQDEQTQLQGIGQGAQSSLLKYAPQSDSQNSLASPALQALTAEIARQEGLAAQNQGAQRSFGAAQGGNYQGEAARNLGTFSMKGQEALRGIAQNAQVKNEPLTAKIAGLEATKGADLASAIGKLRQQEISNKIANTGLGIKQDALKQTASNNAANQRLAQQRINVTLSGQKITESNAANSLSETTRHDRATEALNSAKQAWDQAHPKGSASNPSQTGLNFNQQQKLYNGVDKITDLVKALRANGSTSGQIWRFLTQGGKFSNKHGNFQSPGYPSWAVQAAYDLAVYGYINKRDAANLAKNGLTRQGYYQVR